MASAYEKPAAVQYSTWGAMTAPCGARTDFAVQRAREAVATFLSAVTPWEWDAPPSARYEARVRGR